MSGYRSYHRQQLITGGKDLTSIPEDDNNKNNNNNNNDGDNDNEIVAIWSIVTTPLLQSPAIARIRKQQSTNNNNNNNSYKDFRLWTACSDGYIRTFHVQHNNTSKSSSSSNSVDAMNCYVRCTHLLLPSLTTTTTKEETNSTQQKQLLLLGCTKVCTIRNYTGTDTNVGELIVASVSLAGKVCLYRLPENWDDTIDNNDDTTTTTTESIVPIIPGTSEFTINDATGTTASFVPPSQSLGLYGSVVVFAIGCLEGTIALVSTGIPIITTTSTTESNNNIPQVGTILDTLGRPGSSIPLSLVCHSNPISGSTISFAVGRQDGTIDMYRLQKGSGNTYNNNNTQQQQYRMNQLIGYPVRSIDIMDDGQLLIAGNDDGTICLWDIGRGTSPPALVNHILDNKNNNGWIISLRTLIDNRRFVTMTIGGSTPTVSIWKLGQSIQQQQPIHIFQLDTQCWTMDRYSVTDHNNNNTQQQHQSYIICASENGSIQIFTVDE